MGWVGVAISDAQVLAFPRSGSYFDPTFGCEIVFPDDDIPLRMFNAVCELALHLLNNEDILTESGSVHSISLGNISLSTITQTPKVPSSIKQLIKPLLNRGTNSWWRAN